jgi:predicted trehalose synthase
MAASSTILDVLAGWIGDQRWFAGKGTVPALRSIGSWDLYADHEISITTLLVLDESSARPVLYQVPLTRRRAPVAGAEAAFIGELTDGLAGGDDDRIYLYDGPHDRDYATHLLQLVTAGGHADGDGMLVDGVPVAARECTNVRSHVLRGEQSNTSIVYEYDAVGGEAGQRAICKVFRTLHHGENPDVVLQSALYTAGSRSVPETLGSVVGQWRDPREPEGVARGHLAFAQEFLAGAEDAWRRALVAAASGEDFSGSARAIGIATADIHSTLATAMPTVVAGVSDIADAVDGWHQRLTAAIVEVPDLEEFREAIESLYARAATAPWPSLQRIHGDFHLGQVLAMPDGGWAVIDFEGEPMRPLAERSVPDVALRDVAGMLRSFDYVAGAEQDAPGIAEWATVCREAFIDGYIERSGVDVRAQSALLDAFELDKALYEAVYEARNRPAWLAIPTAAVRRLAVRAGQRD